MKKKVQMMSFFPPPDNDVDEEAYSETKRACYNNGCKCLDDFHYKKYAAFLILVIVAMISFTR
eukprot:131847-Ditylum_brightwellii.AAC.1